MHKFTVEIRNGTYMSQLQNSHHQVVYVRRIKWNQLPVVYIQLQMISESYFRLTYKGMKLLHINNHLQYKYYCIKLNN